MQPTLVFAKRLSSIQQKIIITQSDTCSLRKIQDRNLTTFLDLSAHIIDHPAVSCFSQSCVTEREPGAQSQNTHYQSSGTQPYGDKTVTFSDRKHGRDEIDVVTFHEREITRGTQGMHGFQDPHKELILDQLRLGSAEEN